MASRLRPLLPDLFRFDDTCAVYVVRHGGRAVLIDFGDGEVLDELPSIGVAAVDWVLHTHFHRDQCGGDRKAVGRRIPVAVPEHERRYFEHAEDFRRARRLFHSADVLNDLAGPVADVRVARPLRDGETLECGPLRFRVVPAPGHTPGSIALIAEINGAVVAFTGDLIHSPGRVLSLFDLQYRAGATDGVAAALHSLQTLAGQRPDLLCPSHGPEMTQPAAAIAETTANLRRWYDARAVEPALPSLGDAPAGPFASEPDDSVVRINRDLVAVCAATTFYAVVDASGGAGLLIDYGAAAGEAAAAMVAGVDGGPALRHLAHPPTEPARLGCTSVEVVIPTGVVDAAICGIPALAAAGTRVWAHECLADVLARPSRRRLPGLMARPIRVDRVLREGETFQWRGRRFTVRRLPSAGRFAVGLFAEIAGQRCGFTGDALVGGAPGPAFPRPTFAAGMTADGRVRTAAVLADESPDWICPGRGLPLRPAPTDLLRLAADAEADRDLCRRLVAEPVDRGLDPSWAAIEPYRIPAARGDQFRCEVRVRNVETRPIAVRARLTMPTEWRAEPAQVEFTVAPGETGAGAWDVLIPAPFVPVHRTQSIAADLWIDGRHLGQVADAFVHVGEVGAGPSST
jgi:glyoxylase-like metal-dependent hydrolase (beta-lactamase superfamily II)